MTVKEQVAELLNKLPDDCTFEDVQYEIYVMEKFRAGLESAEKDGTLSQEEVEQRMSKWLIE
jgi:hypothetical protein